MSSLEQILPELRDSARRLITLSLWPPTDAAQTIFDVVATALAISSAPPRPEATALEAGAAGWRAMATALERAADADTDLARALSAPGVWQSASGDACRRSLTHHADRTGTLRFAPRRVKLMLLGKGGSPTPTPASSDGYDVGVGDRFTWGGASFEVRDICGTDVTLELTKATGAPL